MTTLNSSLLFPVLVFAAAFSRLLPHPPNFTPVAAIALFAGAAFHSRLAGLGVAIVAMLLSDLILGFHATMWAVYLSFIITGFLGMSLRHKIRPVPVLGGALLSSLIFFLLTNFAVWLEGTLYPMTWEGLGLCYAAALPFYRATLAGDLIYSAILFGIAYTVLSPVKQLPPHWARA